jgi:drug/metabolite transporter (DMT)-like permease
MIYLLIAMFLFTAASLLGAAASRRFDPSFISAIINIVAVFPPVILSAALFSKKTLDTQKPAIFMAICAGILIGFFAMTIGKSYTVNKVGVVVPVIYGGTILLTTVLSYFIFKESLRPLELSGLFFVLIGISVLIYARATV